MLIMIPCLRVEAAALCGTAAALTLAPLYLWPLMIPAYSGLLWLLNTAKGWRGAFLLGWVFGLAYFLVGLHWVGQAFLVDAEKFAWMMPFAVSALSAGLALFSALAAGATRHLSKPGLSRLFAFALFWGLTEWLRGSILTGFPWLLSGHVWAAATHSLQAAAYLGASSLGLFAVFASAAPATLLTASSGRRRPATLANLAGFAAIGIILSVSLGRMPEGNGMMRPDVRLRLIQAGIPQKDKWRPELRDRHLATYLRLSHSPNDRGQQPSFSHLIWPETAMPFFLARDPVRRNSVAGSLPKGAVLITGTPRHGTAFQGQVQLRNAIVSLSSNGDIRLIYDKAHLVPFGEYLPLRSVLATLGLEKLVDSAVDFTPGKNVRVVKLANLPAFRPLICYEIIFPREILPRKGELEPKWLLNVTNDAWFGDSFGPRQHLDIARIRAVEFGLPVVRAANTGISAIIDPYGRVLVQLPLSTSGVIDSPLPLELPKTPYSRFGDFIFGGLILILIFSLIFNLYLNNDVFKNKNFESYRRP